MRSKPTDSARVASEKNVVPQGRIQFLWAALGAGFLTLIVHFGVAWATNKYPFGKVSSAVGDMAWQFQAFYSSVQDLASSSGEVGLTYNWHGGMGYPFLPDYSTYIGGVFPWLTLLFPDGYSELAMFTVLMLKIALASALLAVLLLLLKPEQKWFLAAGIGALYGTSGWVMDAGIHRIMWNDGLLGLPLLAIIALIGYRRKLFVPGAVGIALIWWGNYYSAFYASIGAALFLLSYLFAQSTPRSLVLKRMALFGLQGILGVLLTSATLIPTYLAVSDGIDQAGRPFESYDYSRFLLRMLPMVVDDYSWIGTSVGSIGLVLVIFYIVTPSVSLRSKISWLSPVLFMLLCYSSHLVMLLWNLGDWPNGSWYRSSFILVFFLVVIAWQGLAALRLVASTRRNLYIWSVVAAVLVVLLLISLPAWDEVKNVPLYAPVALAVIGIMCALASLSRNRAIATVLVVLIFAATGAELVVGGSQMRLLQAKYLAVSKVRDLELPSYAPAIAAYRNSKTSWPWTRLGVRERGIPYNDGTWNHYPSSTFYSSIAPPIVADTLFHTLGYSGSGRFFSTGFAQDLDAISAVSGNLLKAKNGTGFFPHSTLPMVRQSEVALHSKDFITQPHSPSDVFHNRAIFLGDIYRPVVGISEKGKDPAQKITNSRATRVVVHCPADTIPTPSFFAKDYSMRWAPRQLSGNRWRYLLYGTLGKGGIEADYFRCFDSKKLAQTTDAVWKQHSPSQLEISGGSITTSFAAATRYPVVIATAAYPGWSCSADGNPAEVSNTAGLLTIQNKGWKTLSCSFSPMGLFPGIVMTVLVAVLLLLLEIALLRRWKLVSPRSMLFLQGIGRKLGKGDEQCQNNSRE